MIFLGIVLGVFIAILLKEITKLKEKLIIIQEEIEINLKHTLDKIRNLEFISMDINNMSVNNKNTINGMKGLLKDTNNKIDGLEHFLKIEPKNEWEINPNCGTKQQIIENALANARSLKKIKYIKKSKHENSN